MEKRRVTESRTRSAEQVNREKALREKYQRERPTLDELLASGEFDEPIAHGDLQEKPLQLDDASEKG